MLLNKITGDKFLSPAASLIKQKITNYERCKRSNWERHASTDIALARSFFFYTMISACMNSLWHEINLVKLHFCSSSGIRLLSTSDRKSPFVMVVILLLAS